MKAATVAKVIVATLITTFLAGCIVVPTGPGYYGYRHGHGSYHRY